MPRGRTSPRKACRQFLRCHCSPACRTSPRPMRRCLCNTMGAKSVSNVPYPNQDFSLHGLTPENMLKFPPAAPQIPSELSRLLKSAVWQKKLVPGSLGGTGVAVTVSDDSFGSVGVCLHDFSRSVSCSSANHPIMAVRMVSANTHAKAPYPRARRVQKNASCIFGSFVFRYSSSEVVDIMIKRCPGHYAHINIRGSVRSIPAGCGQRA